MDFGNDQEGGSESNQQEQRRRRYHRYTPHQIQALEALFNECPHPDETQRAELGRDLGLDACRIKFWFQNRRTQMKVQHERQDNSFLRAENEKIRCQNIALREAVKNAMCPNCVPPVAEGYFDELRLRMENARLKEELAGLTSRPLGRPFPQMPQDAMSMSPPDLSMGGVRMLPQGTPQMPASALDLSMGDVPMGGHHQPFCGGLSLDLDLSGAGLSEGCGKQDWGAHSSTYRK